MYNHRNSAGCLARLAHQALGSYFGTISDRAPSRRRRSTGPPGTPGATPHVHYLALHCWSGRTALPGRPGLEAARETANRYHVPIPIHTGRRPLQRHRRLQPLGHPQGRLAADQHHRALPGRDGPDGRQRGARLALPRDPGPGPAGGGTGDPHLHLLPRLLPRLVLRLAAGQPHRGLHHRHPHLHALRRLEAQPQHPPRHGRRSGQPGHRRRVDHDRGGVPGGAAPASAWATGWCAIRSSCCWWCRSGCR